MGSSLPGLRMQDPPICLPSALAETPGIRVCRVTFKHIPQSLRKSLIVKIFLFLFGQFLKMEAVNQILTI